MVASSQNLVDYETYVRKEMKGLISWDCYARKGRNVIAADWEGIRIDWNCEVIAKFGSSLTVDIQLIFDLPHL